MQGTSDHEFRGGAPGKGFFGMKSFLLAHWVAGAGFMAAALVALWPVVSLGWPAALSVLYLALPAYMLHQVEEHAGDRFRRFVNTVVCGGREGLTAEDVLWINIGGVWLVDLVAFYAARLIAPGWGLTAVYLMLVNGISHVGGAVKFRGYNPGLVTSVILFLPLSAAALAVVPSSFGQHALGLTASVAIHAGIIAHLRRRLARA
jgi:hypothetical protein